MLRSESNEDEINSSLKSKVSEEKVASQDRDTNKGGIFQFLQANLLSDTSN